MSFEGETGPYIQYTYARLRGVLRKLHTIFEEDATTNEENSIIFDDQQSEKELEDIKELLFQLSTFDEMIREVNHEYKPHLLARYTLDLCQKINSFYQAYRIVSLGDRNLSIARSSVLHYSQAYLEKAMNLLGIDCIEEM